MSCREVVGRSESLEFFRHSEDTKQTEETPGSHWACEYQALRPVFEWPNHVITIICTSGDQVRMGEVLDRGFGDLLHLGLSLFLILFLKLPRLTYSLGQDFALFHRLEPESSSS